MKNNTNKFSVVFRNYINLREVDKKKKLSLINIQNTFVGKQKYFPPVSKEWKNSVYVFNKNNLKNLPLYDLNINEIIKNYFDLYLNPKFTFTKKKYKKQKYLSLNKIYVSKAEIKHTNNKAILTIYVYNREKISLLKKIKLIKKSFYKKIISLLHYNKNMLKLDSYNFYYKIIKILLFKELIILRKYKLRLNLNLYKFEEKLLFKLKNLIKKFYNKRVEFNIINLKSIILSSEFVTKLLQQKIKNKKTNIIRIMGIIFNKAVLPKTNRIIEKSATIKSVDWNLLENKFKSLYLNSILNNNDLTELYKNVYSTDYDKINKIIFNSINYKNLGGLRLEVKGRLSKRNRADRSLFKVKWKGGLKNIDSSYKRLSSVNMRGYIKSNVEYSIFTSKRRIGAFAVKGWVSGK